MRGGGSELLSSVVVLGMLLRELNMKKKDFPLRCISRSRRLLQTILRKTLFF